MRVKIVPLNLVFVTTLLMLLLTACNSPVAAPTTLQISGTPNTPGLPAASSSREDQPGLTTRTAPVSNLSPGVEGSAGVTPSVAHSSGNGLTCRPTFADELSPTYKPDAPVRNSVGKGRLLTGTVKSSLDCGPIRQAKLELWTENGKGEHPDEYRATIFTNAAGMYQFECNPTDHIHMRISATGYRTIASNAYHPGGQTHGNFDIVLTPA